MGRRANVVCPGPLQVLLALLKLRESDKAEVLALMVPSMNGDLDADGFGDSPDGGHLRFEAMFGLGGEGLGREATSGREMSIIVLTMAIHDCFDGSIGSRV